ncbi:MAG: N-acetylmuramoyl-L-alanine amidase [Candidatus Thermoplasmatota archaeon]|nr:N-acetylmuramoyl-L-alanine amidase [Candidatus Thermoplasmatota archaeon]
MNIADHVLQEAQWRPSPNCGGLIEPTLVVIHYTGDDSLEGALSWLASRRSGVSAHLVIGQAGEVYQMVPFNRAAWHAGRSSYNGRAWVNRFSVGIENVGAGEFWPEAQVQRLLECLDALLTAYAIEDIVGHEHVAPGRKVDPGPLFPWELIRQRYFSQGQEGIVGP